MHRLRLLTAAGAGLFIAGALVGWFRDLEADSAIQAHELVTLGAWAYVAIAPMVLAPLAPFERRWLRWLWVAPWPAVAAVAVAGAALQGAELPFPWYGRADEKMAGLAMSLVGAMTSALALGTAWREAPEHEPGGSWRRPALAMTAIAAVAAGTSLVVRDIARERIEDRLEAEIRATLRSCPPEERQAVDIRVRCREVDGRWDCSERLVWPDGSEEGAIGSPGGPAAVTGGC